MIRADGWTSQPYQNYRFGHGWDTGLATLGDFQHRGMYVADLSKKQIDKELMYDDKMVEEFRVLEAILQTKGLFSMSTVEATVRGSCEKVERGIGLCGFTARPRDRQASARTATNPIWLTIFIWTLPLFSHSTGKIDVMAYNKLHKSPTSDPFLRCGERQGWLARPF